MTASGKKNVIGSVRKGVPVFDEIGGVFHP